MSHHEDELVWQSKYKPIDKHFLRQRNINVLRLDHHDEVVMKILIGEEFQTYSKLDQIFDKNKEKTKYLVPILDVGQFDFLKDYAIVPKAKYSLTKYLSEKQENLFNDWTICLQITESLHQLHDLNIIHCNLCPDNIFYFEEEERFKIGNFNSAKICPFKKDAIEKVDIQNLFQAPEVLQSLAFSTMSDVFSLGVVIFQILSKSPFIDSPFRKCLSQLVLGESKELVKIIEDSSVNNKLQKILQPLLNIDPETRPNASSIIEELSIFNQDEMFFRDTKFSNNEAGKTPRGLLLHGPPGTVKGLTIVNKTSLIPQVKDWKRSAKCEISTIDGKKTQYYFIGFEKGNSNSSTSNLVCFKDTGKGVFGGDIIVVSESRCEFSTNVKIEQPWYHSKVNVYRNSVITQVFDEILKQSLNGVSSRATFIGVMKYMIDNGIPIFIVGGAVRDVIREVLVDKKINAYKIMQNIKDIDIRFGCDPQTFYRILSRKYTSGIHVPGPRGLVQIGIANGSDLFLEGKAINGLNNDNNSVSFDVAQCYGTNLRGENICTDFTCNSLWYDPLNKCIIDTIGNGKGIKDVLSKTLRIPVKEVDWDYWVSGNPTKLMGFYKFLIKGYTADEKTRKYIINRILNGGFISKMEIRTQYTKSIGISNKAKLEQLLRADLGDQYYNTHFAQHIK